jgi:hypothetical protein
MALIKRSDRNRMSTATMDHLIYVHFNLYQCEAIKQLDHDPAARANEWRELISDDIDDDGLVVENEGDPEGSVVSTASLAVYAGVEGHDDNMFNLDAATDNELQDALQEAEEEYIHNIEMARQGGERRVASGRANGRRIDPLTKEDHEGNAVVGHPRHSRGGRLVRYPSRFVE